MWWSARSARRCSRTSRAQRALIGPALPRLVDRRVHLQAGVDPQLDVLAPLGTWSRSQTGSAALEEP